jgi:hypothetical protein
VVIKAVDSSKGVTVVPSFLKTPSATRLRIIPMTNGTTPKRFHGKQMTLDTGNTK